MTSGTAMKFAGTTGYVFLVTSPTAETDARPAMVTVPVTIEPGGGGLRSTTCAFLNVNVISRCPYVRAVSISQVWRNGSTAARASSTVAQCARMSARRMASLRVTSKAEPCHWRGGGLSNIQVVCKSYSSHSMCGSLMCELPVGWLAVFYRHWRPLWACHAPLGDCSDSGAAIQSRGKFAHHSRGTAPRRSRLPGQLTDIQSFISGGLRINRLTVSSSRPASVPPAGVGWPDGPVANTTGPADPSPSLRSEEHTSA